MEKTKVIDSSVWIALFLDDDSQHEKASKLFYDHNGSIIIPYCVISEVVSVLTYKHSYKQAENFLKHINKRNDVFFYENQIDEEVQHFLKIRQKISLTDSSIIYITKKTKSELATFDKQLERIYRKNLKAKKH